MVRPMLTAQERERGQRLGAALRAARGDRPMTATAASAGISVETLRKIEAGRIPTPAFFTIAAIAGCLGLGLDELAGLTGPGPDAHPADPLAPVARTA